MLSEQNLKLVHSNGATDADHAGHHWHLLSDDLNRLLDAARAEGRAQVPEAAGPIPTDKLSEARGIEIIARLERYEDCLRTVCHHLQLPQSESGPCDDPARYERELEGLEQLLDEAEAGLKLAQERRFRAEAALHPFAEAGKQVSGFWAGDRRAASIQWDGLKVDDFRKAAQAMAVTAKSSNSPAQEGGDA